MNNRYFNEVIRSFAVYLDQTQNPGEGRHTSFSFNRPARADDFGLEDGKFYTKGLTLLAGRCYVKDFSLFLIPLVPYVVMYLQAQLVQ